PRESRSYVCTTQVLVAVLIWFGMGSGAPKKQPAWVQLRLCPPVSASFEGPSSRVSPAQQSTSKMTGCTESGVTAGGERAAEPDPRYSPAHARPEEAPLVVVTVPQSPLPTVLTRC